MIIFKSDAYGRLFVPVERQVEFERSGLSCPQFAAMAGLNYQTFTTWRRKHGTLPATRRRSSLPPTGLGVWMEAAVEPGCGSALTVMLPGGASVSVSHLGQASLAAQLIKSLASLSC